jgi:hypothetical protein
MRELIEKYFDIAGHRTDNIKDVINQLLKIIIKQL